MDLFVKKNAKRIKEIEETERNKIEIEMRNFCWLQYS